MLALQARLWIEGRNQSEAVMVSPVMDDRGADGYFSVSRG